MLHFPPAKIVYHSSKGTFTLRPLCIEDTPAIFMARKLSESSLKRFMSFAHMPSSLLIQHEWVAQKISHFHLLQEDLVLGLFDSHQHFIGLGGWNKTNTLNADCYEISYWVSKPYQRKGNGFLIAQLLIYGAFEWLQATRVQVTAHVSNKESLRIIEKCGFHYEGLLRNYLSPPTQEMLANGMEPGCDAMIYALLPSDLQMLAWYKEIALHTAITPLYQELEHPHPTSHSRALSTL